MGAIVSGNLDAVKLLIQSGASPSLTGLMKGKSGDCTKLSALHVAALYNRVEITQYLIDFIIRNQQSIDPVSPELGTPLMIWAGKDNLAIVRKLIENGVDILKSNDSQEMVLHTAADSGATKVLGYLLKYCQDKNIDAVNAKSKSGRTPLMVAAASGHQQAFDLLLECGADLNGRAHSELTILCFAIAPKSLDFLQHVIEKYRENNKSIDELFSDYTALAYAVKYGSVEQVKVLLRAGARRDVRLSGGITVIHQAAQCENTEILKALLTNISDEDRHALVDSGDSIEKSPLGYAAEANNPAAIELLLSYDADIEKSSIDASTPLIRAACKGHQEAFDVLLEHHANLNARNNRGLTILMAAVHSKQSLFLRHVIREYRKKDMSIHELFDGDTALSLAISIDAIDQVTVLLEEGAQRDYRFTNGETIIHRAARERETEALEALLTVNISDDARRDLIDAANNVGETPLMIASNFNQVAAIQLLLDYDANIEKRSNDGSTALRFAAEGHPEATKALLEAGANPNHLANFALKPMTFAVKAYDLACAKLLVQHGALLNDAFYIAGALRQAPAEHYPQSDAMFHFLHSQGAMISAVVPDFPLPLRPGTMERLAVLRQQDAPYAAAIASGPAAVRALLETPGLRPLRWRDTRMAKHANNGTYELLLVKARADERLALYQGSQRVFVSYIADRIQEANQYYKGEEEKKVVPCNLDVLIMICGLNKKHLPQYPHLTKEDIEDVQKAVLSRLKSNAETLAKWRAIQAHMADSENEEYKIFRGAPEKIAELKARAAAESQRGDASRALLFSDSGKRGAASRPRAAAAARPAKQAKAMAEVDSSEEAPKGKRAKRKPN
jgi:ankyrin repeat protein